MDGFSGTIMSEHFSKICPENSSPINFWQEQLVFHMNAYVHLWLYLAQFFL
jgi:hypothetical protein